MKHRVTKVSKKLRREPSLSKTVERLSKKLELDGNIDCNMVTHFSVNLLEAVKRPDFKQIAPQLESFAKELKDVNEYVGKGYKISYEPARVCGGDKYKGNNLAIKDSKNRAIGTMGIKIGMPVEIHLIQGNGKGASDFYKNTGTHFDQILMKKAISLMANNLKMRGTKAVLSENALAHMTPIIDEKGKLRSPMRNRLLDFLPVDTAKKVRALQSKKGFTVEYEPENLDEIRIRNNYFSDARHNPDYYKF